MRSDVHHQAMTAEGGHASCPDPARCDCECRACKRTWSEAGRPRPPDAPPIVKDFSERQWRVDMAAVQIAASITGVAPPDFLPAGIARRAYDVAEALIAEGERRVEKK